MVLDLLAAPSSGSSTVTGGGAGAGGLVQAGGGFDPDPSAMLQLQGLRL